MSKRIVWTNQFKKDYKTAIKQGLPIEELDHVIRLLASEKSSSPNSKTTNYPGTGKASENAIFSQIGF